MIDIIISAIAAIATSAAAIIALRSHCQQQKQNRRTLFDTTFFNMLQMHQQILTDLVYHRQEKVGLISDTAQGREWHQEIVTDEHRGRDLFYQAFCEFEFNVILPGHRNHSTVHGLRDLMKYFGFDDYYRCDLPTYFDHYFRHLYTILKYIDKSSDILTTDEQYQYSSILRSTLSRYELVWLYYNGLSEYGCDKLKPLIEKYCMLKNLRTDLLTVCKENLAIIAKSGKTIADVKNAKFELSDYLFYTSIQKDDIGKYHLSAFYRPSDMPKASKYLQDWNKFLKKETTINN